MVEPVIEIEVVYAAVDRQILRTLSVPEGATVREAVLKSGIGDEFPELDLNECPLGIFGKVVADPQVRLIQAGDRIEIYRPLLADPKEVRRLRAAKAAEAKARNQ
ncbi:MULTISPECIES: RnfH family protein [unclassified Pseudomonas]|uniref:RnfH family protein n=1 Tax=unclassified Pseudomonas TaxID=196821 RepID=UPI000CD587A8|nr:MULTISPECIES: RnfH family protein [unclassified Pseudomonas]MCU1775321.1 RnfH family protein [Pseudomonas sp. 13B_3.2_Bac1]RBC00657.1 RnfH family protein [Pseudomonas sp. MWU12-2115]